MQGQISHARDSDDGLRINGRRLFSVGQLALPKAFSRKSAVAGFTVSLRRM